MSKKRQFGFTLIEILVVLVVISVLIGLLFPALRGSVIRAKKTSELNKIRQVGAAWAMYSVSNLDRLLPGHLTTRIQERWDVAWAYPDESLVPPAPFYELEDPNIAGPWPWRILDRMNYSWDLLIDYKPRTWNDMQVTDHAEEIATQPAFGYNGYYLGGFWETDGHFHTPRLKYSKVVLQHGQVESVVARVASQIPIPSKMVTFCSSFYAQIGEHRHLEDDIDGFNLAVPRILAEVSQWEPLDDGVEVFEDTSPPLGRYNGLPAIFFADGHVDDVRIDELADQSMWIPTAKDMGNTPAFDFSHSE
ncbi:MAG: prepilin-type N-terminal cleavage/methylation domain-containing protein [Phycisphaerales bacterium]|nr:prepilin-type N-terminal cleavage/methylation domain-containing protein [Phycisphaerales bacterium]